MTVKKAAVSAGAPSRQVLPGMKTGCRCLFFVFAWLFLGLYNSEVLYKTQDFNLFLCGDHAFFTSMLQHQGGLLTYAGRYLTQFFYFPLLGAAMLALLLSLLEWAVSQLVPLKGYASLLHFVPSLLLLLAQTSVGYYIYLEWEPSFLFITVLGTLLALGAAASFRCFNRSGAALRVILALLLVAAVWAVAGSFMWLTACCITAECLKRKDGGLSRYTGAAALPAAFVCLVASGSLFYAGFGETLTAPLPDISFFEPVVPVLLSGMAVVLLTFMAQNTRTDAPGTSATWKKSAGLLAAGCLAVALLSYHDANFRTELTLQHLFTEQDWDGIFRKAEKVRRPTRAISAYRAVALANTPGSALGNCFFDYDFDYKPVKCRKEVPERILYYADFELCTSVINSSYRWNAEFCAKYGYRPALLKSMIMAALVNRELNLATRYLKILNQTTFHKIWALRTTHYLNDIHTLYEIPFYQAIIDRLPSEDIIEDFNGTTYLFSYLGEEPDMLERSLIVSLYFKRIDVFCAKLKRLSDDYVRSLPIGIQEGIAFAGLAVDESYLEQFSVPQVIMSNVREFQRRLNATTSWEEAREELKPQFGGTVPYYMVFGDVAEYDFPTIGTGSGLY